MLRDCRSLRRACERTAIRLSVGTPIATRLPPSKGAERNGARGSGDKSRLLALGERTGRILQALRLTESRPKRLDRHGEDFQRRAAHCFWLAQTGARFPTD